MNRTVVFRPKYLWDYLEFNIITMCTGNLYYMFDLKVIDEANTLLGNNVESSSRLLTLKYNHFCIITSNGNIALFV